MPITEPQVLYVCVGAVLLQQQPLAVTGGHQDPGWRPPGPRPRPAPAPGPRVGGVLAAEVEQGARRPHLQRRAAVAARGLAARQRGQGAHVPPRALTPVRVVAGLPRAQREPAM